MEEKIECTVNGKPTILRVDGERKLLWVLRTDLGLTGAKYGCGESFCGACTVIVGNEAVRSCQVPVKNVAGKDILTVEGLAVDRKLHAVQKAFAQNDAMQCGYCTPGMVMNAVSLLRKIPHPSEDEIVSGMDDNFCRCGAHPRIVRAIQAAAQEGGF